MNRYGAPNDPMDASDFGVEVRQVDPGIAQQMAGAQVAQMVGTAKQYPRSIAVVKKQATELATMDEDTASACTYSLPRGDKTITGPSVKFAQIIASCWGNLWVQCTPVSEDKRFVTVRAVAWDVEKNVCVAFDVKRRITGRSGRTFNDDMIGVTTNAAASIAYRNAVLRIVPDAFTRSVLEAARRVARGDSSTLEERRDKMFAHFASMGVDERRVFSAVGVSARDDIGLDEFEVLLGIANAIRFDGMEIDSVFPNIRDGAAVVPVGGSKTSALRDMIKSKSTPAGVSGEGPQEGAEPEPEPVPPVGRAPKPDAKSKPAGPEPGFLPVPDPVDSEPAGVRLTEEEKLEIRERERLEAELESRGS